MSKRLPPRRDEVLVVAAALEGSIPLDEDLTMDYHVSAKGYTGIRIQGKSLGRSWFLDMYQGPWFYISVPPFEPTTANNLYSMIVAISVMLKG